MRRKAILMTLFTMAGIWSANSVALGRMKLPSKETFFLMEELPVELRAKIYEKLLKYFLAHPEVAAKAKIIAVDRQGGVHVLDENIVLVGSCQPCTMCS